MVRAWTNNIAEHVSVDKMTCTQRLIEFCEKLGASPENMVT